MLGIALVEANVLVTRVVVILEGAFVETKALVDSLVDNGKDEAVVETLEDADVVTEVLVLRDCNEDKTVVEKVEHGHVNTGDPLLTTYVESLGETLAETEALDTETFAETDALVLREGETLADGLMLLLTGDNELLGHSHVASSEALDVVKICTGVESKPFVLDVEMLGIALVEANVLVTRVVVILEGAFVETEALVLRVVKTLADSVVDNGKDEDVVETLEEADVVTEVLVLRDCEVLKDTLADTESRDTGKSGPFTELMKCL